MPQQDMGSKNMNINTNSPGHESAALTYEQWKNDFLRVVLRVTGIVFLIAILSAFSVNTLPNNIIYLSLVAIVFVAGIAPLPYSIRGFVLLATLFIGATNLLLLWGVEGEASMVYLGIIGLTALLYERRLEFITLILTAASILIVAALTINGQHTLYGWTGLSDEFYAIMVATWTDWITYLVDVAAVGLILIFAVRLLKGKFNSILEEAKRSLNELAATGTQLEARVDERTVELNAANIQISHRAEQFQAISEVARSIAVHQDLEILLSTITRLVSERFSFYHVGIFLLDEKRKFAVLRAANSEGGQKMLKRNHRLKVGHTGIVGNVTSTGTPRIALDTGVDTVYFDNPDLPKTRSEVALPLSLGGEVIGALDIQSTEANAFSNEEVAVFSVLADQLAIAIQNARSLAQARTAAAEAEKVARQLVGQAWSNIKSFTPIVGYRFDGSKPEPLNQPTNGQQAEDQKEAFSVPVQLRGESIGSLRIKPSVDGHQWSEDEIAIIRATAERVALAAENARLILESQKNAAKEQVIGEISTKIGAAINLDNILQTTLREMGRILPGAEISIQVENE